MFERKETIIKNKKYFISHEYIRKIFDSTTSQRNIKFKDTNPDFKKVGTIQKINISNDPPLVLFHKPCPNNVYKYENQIKKDLIENKGYLNDGGYKQKLLKYHSYHNTDQSQSKNIFRSSFSQKKNRSKNNDNQNLFNSKRSSFSIGLNKRTIQKDYSNSIKIKNKRSNIKHKEEKDKENKLFNSVKIKDIKNRELLIKKLTNKSCIVKNLFGNPRINKIQSNTIKEIDYKRKKDYLEHNNISFDKIEIENDENNKKNKKLKDIKDIKDIKFDDKRISKTSKKINFDINNVVNNNDNKHYKKKRYKDIVNQFEFLKKIKKEFNILRKSKEKDKKCELSKKN